MGRRKRTVIPIFDVELLFPPTPPLLATISFSFSLLAKAHGPFEIRSLSRVKFNRWLAQTLAKVHYLVFWPRHRYNFSIVLDLINSLFLDFFSCVYFLFGQRSSSLAPKLNKKGARGGRKSGIWQHLLHVTGCFEGHWDVSLSFLYPRVGMGEHFFFISPCWTCVQFRVSWGLKRCIQLFRFPARLGAPLLLPRWKTTSSFNNCLASFHLQLFLLWVYAGVFGRVIRGVPVVRKSPKTFFLPLTLLKSIIQWNQCVTFIWERLELFCPSSVNTIDTNII
jgi:hypothetical protein